MGDPDANPANHATGDDLDADGVKDRDEIRILTRVTNPFKADTDKDFMSDGAELAAGCDPVDPDTDKNGIVDGNEPATAATRCVKR